MIHGETAPSRAPSIALYAEVTAWQTGGRGREWTEVSAVIITCPVVSKSISSTRSFPIITVAVNNTICRINTTSTSN